MNFKWVVTVGLLGSGSVAQAAELAGNLPSGALMTLEFQQAQGAVGRFMNLAAKAVAQTDAAEQTSNISAVTAVLNASVAQESVLGVFGVGKVGKTFTPQVLGVTRVTGEARSVFADLSKNRPTARVGNYTFARQDDVFMGYSQGLAYFSTDKDLLMAYLGRLSGKAAPRLQESAAYTVPTRTNGPQEISTFFNFSATAKVVRSQLGQWGLPRLLSPLVDALDTLGQYAGGLSTNARGLTTASAQAVNLAGKDTPLARILTHQTTFNVASAIPADAESVQVQACAPESGAYLGRWLTRLDLFEPFGFLTDSQLASHLERSSAYLGDECAQVTLAGANRAGLETEKTLGFLDHTVTYQRVTDRAAAEAALPAYVSSLNRALAGLGESLATVPTDSLLEKGMEEGDLPAGAMLGLATASSGLEDIAQEVGQLKVVYGFSGDYLVVAWSQDALAAALDTSAPKLSDDATFQAAQLPKSGAGWSFGRNLPDLSAADFGAVAAEDEEDAVAFADLTDDEKAEWLGMTSEEYADLTDEEKAELADLEGLLSEEAASTNEQVGRVFADLYNRYDGMTASKAVRGNVVLSKSNILYRW